MNYDVFTVAAVVKELNDRLDNGKIQDTLEIGEEAVGFEIYAGARYYLLCSAHPESSRVQLVSDRLRRGVENPSPLGLMLRRYIEGGRFIKATQPAWERVIHMEFSTADGYYTLIAEPMDRRSNVLLINREGVIMDCIRRVGSDENRVRSSLPGYVYIPPPPQQNKRAPIDLTEADFAALLQSDPAKVGWRALTEVFLGFSPMLAKELVYRASADITAKCKTLRADDMTEAYLSLIPPLLEGRFTPGYSGVDGQITSFSAYKVNFLPGWKSTETISQALTEYYGAPVGEEAYDAGKKPVQQAVEDAIDKASRKLAALKRSQTDDSERERLRLSGEMILAYQYNVTPKQTILSAEYEFDQPPLEIKLDPELTPLENAQAYFEKYEKAKRALTGVPSLIEDAREELAYLKQLENDLALATNFPEIGEVQDALQRDGYWKGHKTQRPGSGKSGPMKIQIDDLTVWIGRNSRQNEEVTFVKGKPEDTWLHIRGLPGAHVVIKNSGRPVPPAVMRRAAELAAYYSGARKEGRAEVDVTERRYVRKIKGGKPGMVTYRNEIVLEVTPTDNPALKSRP